MRPQQQGRRQRNRNSGGGGGGGGNNRRNQNPLARNYESNGPDVKIRGNAQLIADKYTTLARDALSSGDNVMAENYLQHAEHYNRIIMAAQAQMQTQREERGQFDESDGDDNDDDGSTDAMSSDGGDRPYREQQDQRDQREPREQRNRDRDRKQVNGDAQPSGRDASEEPQPVIGETPAEVALEEQEHAASGQPRRSTPRRPRKPRRNPDDQPATEAGPDSSETVAAEV